MARTIQQIYDEMIAEKNSLIQLNALQPNIDSAQTFLSDLTTASKVAVFRTIFFVIAVAIWTHEKLFDDHVAWIEQRASELIVGTSEWYAKKALEFQYGDPLIYVNDIAQYATINPANQLVKLVAANDIAGQVYLKVAKLSGTTPIALSVPELAAFEAYMLKIKFAGVVVNCLSRDADLLQIQYRVYIDPLLMNLSGELLSDPTVKPVEDAINDYIKNLPFDGKFSRTQLTDKIQLKPGVINPVYEAASAQYGVNPFIALGDYYNPNAGYLKIDPANPLSGSITYIYQS